MRRAPMAALTAGLLYLSVGLTSALAPGCGGSGLPDKVKFAAPPQSILLGGVSVNFQLAHAEDEEMKVRFYFRNVSNQMLVVNRDGIGLRLPDGRVLPRRGYNKEPYFIAPGTGHEVWVAFGEKGLDLRTVQTASVIIGGVAFGSDPVQRVVGEIPLSWAGNADD